MNCAFLCPCLTGNYLLCFLEAFKKYMNKIIWIRLTYQWDKARNTD